MSLSQNWLIIGGGVLGLTVADELLEHGQTVTLAEAAPAIGGLTASHVRRPDAAGGDSADDDDPAHADEIAWDRFYHVTLLSDDRLRDRLRRLDLEDEIRWVETKTGFYADGRLHSMSNTAEFLRFKPLNLFERLRLGGTIFYTSKIRNWRRLEKVSVESFLRRWSGRGAFEKIWLPLLKAKLGEAYRQTSAAFIWAHTSRMYKARRSGAKVEMFGYVPGGYRRILGAWTDDVRRRGGPNTNRSPDPQNHSRRVASPPR